MGHVLMNNRHCLVVDAQVTQATGTAEREAAVDMVGALSGTHRVTLGADKNYDTRDCVDDLRKSRFVGRAKLDFQFVLTFAAYNLVRMRNLGVAACC